MLRSFVLPIALFGLLAEAALALELEEVVKRVEPSVVRVETDQGLGSGVVVDDGGLVLTNLHVIEDARNATIELRSKKTLEVLGFVATDPRHDLALLKTKP